MTITVTKEMIANEICGHLCMMAESNQTEKFELTDKFTLIKDWDNGKPLNVTYEIILKGYHCYGGDDRHPELTKIPQFISNDWGRAMKIYRKLKGL